MATAGNAVRRRAPDAAPRRANDVTLVASTTVVRPAASRRSSCPVEDRERRARRLLVRLVAGDDRAERVRREDRVGREQARGERGLAGTRRADQHDEARLRQLEDARGLHPRMVAAQPAWRRASQPPPSRARTS